MSQSIVTGSRVPGLRGPGPAGPARDAEARPAARLLGRVGGVSRAAVLEGALLLGLGSLALLLRLWNYLLVPAFSDEVQDLNRAFQTARGELFPLTDTSTYIGSLWDWMMAAALRLSGFDLGAGRALMVLLGVLTVLATYVLGRAWGGRLGGLVAAGLLTTSGLHVVVNSHIGWSNSMTPLFTTLGVWSLGRVVASRSGRAATLTELSSTGRRWLLASGACWGLALQTHPTAFPLILAAGAYVALSARHLFRSRWLYLAGLLALLVNANLIIYNLGSQFGSVAYGTHIAAQYAQDEPLSAGSYLRRLAELILGLFCAVGGAIDPREEPGEYLRDPALWPLVLLALAGLARQGRRGNALPALMVAATVVSLPLFRGGYAGPDGRYLTPLLPVLFAGVGAVFAAAAGRVATQTGSAGRWAPAPLALGAALSLAGGFMILHPLLSIRRDYDLELAGGSSNLPIFQTLRLISSNRQADERIFLDRDLLPASVGHRMVGLTLRLAIAMRDIPYRWHAPDGDELLAPANRCRSALVVLSARDPAATQAIVAQLGLRDVDPKRKVLSENRLIQGVYRLDRLPDQRTDADPLGPCRRPVPPGRAGDRA